MKENLGLFNKRDAFAALAIGEIVAWLLFVMAKVNAPELPLPSGISSALTSASTAVILAVVLPILSVLGLYIAALLSKVASFMYEAAKFALVGALNTFLDLGILNLLILVSGISSGTLFIVFKGLSFTIAVINSYFWNKIWTFESREQNLGKEFSQFLFVSVIGLFLNVGMAVLFVNVIGPKFGIAPEPWANVGALAGTSVVFIWNFVGYKFWVFRR